MKMTAHQIAKVAPAIAPASYAAAGVTLGSEIDCQGYDEALVVFHLGVATATGTVVFGIQDCATSGGSYSGAISGTAAPASSAYNVNTDQTLYVARLDLRKRERFIKVSYDVDTDNVIFSSCVILLGAKEAPVTQVNTTVFSV